MPGRLHFPDGQSFDFTADDLVEKECIGTGNYGGVVMRMIHKQTNNVLAVKVEQKRNRIVWSLFIYFCREFELMKSM